MMAQGNGSRPGNRSPDWPHLAPRDRLAGSAGSAPQRTHPTPTTVSNLRNSWKVRPGNRSLGDGSLRIGKSEAEKDSSGYTYAVLWHGSASGVGVCSYQGKS